MSDDPTHVPPEVPIEPILLPESPFGWPPEPCAPARRPRVWTVWVVFFGSQVAHVGAVVLLLIVLAVLKYGPEALSPPRIARAVLEVSESPVGVLSTVLVTMLVLAGAAVLAAIFSPVAWAARLRLQAAKISPLGVGVSIGGVLAIGLIFGALLALGVLPESPALRELSEFIANLSPRALVAAVLVIGVAPGIAEELLFRGYIQTRFAQRWGPGWGILWTSLLFGVMHLDLIHGMFAFVLGIYLGYLTERTGSILPAIICHAVNNTFSTLATAWNVEIVGVAANVAALVGGVVILGVSVWHLRLFVKSSSSDTP